MSIRVQMHPATDQWMMGDRYGTVLSVSKGHVRVKLDKSGRTIRTSYANIIMLEGDDTADLARQANASPFECRWS